MTIAVRQRRFNRGERGVWPARGGLSPWSETDAGVADAAWPGANAGSVLMPCLDVRIGEPFARFVGGLGKKDAGELYVERSGCTCALPGCH